MSLLEKVRVIAKPRELQNRFCLPVRGDLLPYLVDDHQVRSNMAFPEILPLAFERVVPILRGERAAFYQELDQLVNVIDATARA